MTLKEKPILILGDSPGMEKEAKAVTGGFGNPDVMVINRALFRYPGPVKYLVTYHGECVEEWLRAYKGLRPTVVTECGRFDVRFNPQGLSGSSAGLGFQYAYHIGYRKFLLAGIDLEGPYAHFFDAFAGPVRSAYRSGAEVKTVNPRLKAMLDAARREA